MPGPPALARPVDGVDPGHLDAEDLLDSHPDLGLVGVRRHDEGVLPLVEQPVTLLGDHRTQQDVPRVVATPAHRVTSSVPGWPGRRAPPAARLTNDASACSVKTTWS